MSMETMIIQELEICACGHIADIEELDQCATCHQYMCSRPECDCGCPVSEQDD